MAFTFDPAIVTGVLHHMNDDHGDDNVLIARAFGEFSEVSAARMTGFDGEQGHWQVTADGDDHEVSVPWPGGAISERPEVRREIVALYDAACARLGITPRPHN